MRRSGILGNFCGSERRGISGGPARGQFDVIKIRTAWGIARGRSGATLARCTRWARSDFRVGSRRGPEPVEHRPPAERRRQTNGNPESGSGPDLVHRRRPEARMARTRPGPEVVSRGTPEARTSTAAPVHAGCVPPGNARDQQSFLQRVPDPSFPAVDFLFLLEGSENPAGD